MTTEIDAEGLAKARAAYRIVANYPIVPANHDDALENAIRSYLATTRTSEAELVAWRPTYAQIIDLVEACRVRRDNAGESSRMMSKWISEGLNALYTHPTTASDDQVEAVRDVISDLEWVHRQGGLGYRIHDKLEKCISALAAMGSTKL